MGIGTDLQKNRRVVVVGAGIVGASLAYHLACKGAAVTVIEADRAASGATGRSFAWINTAHPKPNPIAALRSAAIREYHRLEHELPDLRVRWTGSITYSSGAEDGTVSAADRPAAVHLSKPQILAIEPNLVNPPDSAAYQAEEGALDAVAATHALLAGAQSHGAKIFTQTQVLGFFAKHGMVTGVETTAGPVEADVLVLAAGTGIASLLNALDTHLPIHASPAIFIRYQTQADRVHTIISNADMEVRQASDGSLLAAEDYVDDTMDQQPMEIARRTANIIQRELRGVTTIEPEFASVGIRPMPADGIPIIGYLRAELPTGSPACSLTNHRLASHIDSPNAAGVYVCAMHPGVTLAAVVGRLAAEEIVDGTRSPALEPCRPDRFL